MVPLVFQNSFKHDKEIVIPTQFFVTVLLELFQTWLHMLAPCVSGSISRLEWVWVKSCKFLLYMSCFSLGSKDFSLSSETTLNDLGYFTSIIAILLLLNEWFHCK